MDLPQFEFLTVSAVRTLVEIAGYALLGQGLLALLAGRQRGDNLVYRLFQFVASPAVRAVRAVTPRLVPDGGIPILAFFILFFLWLGLAVLKRYVCIRHGLQC